ncbi:MAG: hypothetical protein IJM10_03940, partial [Clostridia bacterium]|nr:hypothetical protein [Clostridia bacterium]
YRTIGKIRKTEPLLNGGLFRNIVCREELYVFERTPFDNGRHKLLIVINRSERTVPFVFDEKIDELISGEKGITEIELAPMAAGYIKLSVECEITQDNFR